MVKKIAGIILTGLVMVTVFGYLMAMVLNELVPAVVTGNWGMLWNPGLLLKATTWLYGAVVSVMTVLLYLVFRRPTAKQAKRLLKSKADSVDSSLENSRFMTDKERDENFKPFRFTKMSESKKDGIPVYAVYNKKKRELDLNLASPMHGLVIGATGSGKTTTFINPMIQILGRSSAGSSMICTDPKGELFQLHSGMLAERGYKVMVLDLRDPYSSFRWNPLGDIYDRYQMYLAGGKGIFQCESDVRESGLELVNDIGMYGDVWYEYKGKAYAVRRELITVVKVEKQKIYDELYEDLNDLISVICPIESKDDPVWEKGARSIIMAVCLAMLEDSEYPELEMTRDKFCFFNINKAISNSENEFQALKEYFMGRPKLSKSVGLSRQVLSAADTTLSSYMSIAFDKLSMFNDEGLCSLTSATDIDPVQFAKEPTALFLKIPDEKDTRHALAAVFVLCIYKALIKVASAREDLSLPRNVYFILDEFGNMPKIDKFDKMITVGRSRKIWFNMVVQSYAQLDNVYSQTIANIIKSNCGLKMFIGSNDIETCEEFSKLCGNKTVSTQSVSSSLGDKNGGINVSSQVQTRPLIYPSELQKLNNKTSTGNAIIVTFGNYPLKTRFTPSYKCPLYAMKTMDLSDVRMNAFFGDEVYYDLEERNYIIQRQQEERRQEEAQTVENSGDERLQGMA
ncbi:MAG: type IV secretory system conjugative DNA transfer family protein [Enterocloster asparagiformis]|nr:type IV secretory system conjugative DNA transfer family protein [Enterocloster asparagiformis]